VPRNVVNIQRQPEFRFIIADGALAPLCAPPPWRRERTIRQETTVNRQITRFFRPPAHV